MFPHFRFSNFFYSLFSICAWFFWLFHLLGFVFLDVIVNFCVLHVYNLTEIISFFFFVKDRKLNNNRICFWFCYLSPIFFSHVEFFSFCFSIFISTSPDKIFFILLLLLLLLVYIFMIERDPEKKNKDKKDGAKYRYGLLFCFVFLFW